jgi:hypothetical protein
MRRVTARDLNSGIRTPNISLNLYLKKFNNSYGSSIIQEMETQT